MPLVTGYDDETTLSSILHNLRLGLSQAAHGQQMLGLLGPRPGHSMTDGIDFTEQSCEAVFRYFRRHGVLCVRVLTSGHPAATGYSIVAASTQAGLEHMLTRARTTVRREAMTHRGLRCDVLDSVDDAMESCALARAIKP